MQLTTATVFQDQFRWQSRNRDSTEEIENEAAAIL